MTELDLASTIGSLPVDGKIVTKSQHLPSMPGKDQGIEVATSKAAIEPVWHLPGMAKRFGVSEELLRRALFEGGSFIPCQSHLDPADTFHRDRWNVSRVAHTS